MIDIGLVAVIAVGWIVLSILVAALWHLLMSPLPHPDEFTDAYPIGPASNVRDDHARHRHAA
jgi:hypothetical protein